MSLEEELANTRWKPLRALARGGMAEVHVVSDRYIGGSWALKVLSPELAWPGEGASPEAIERHEREVEALRERLLAEGRILRAAEHENVVHVYEYGLTKSARPYLVMELLEGETLKQALRERGRFELCEAAELLRQALRGIAWVHRLDAVHRDLKPENLYWCAPKPVGVGEGTNRRRVLKILDFGIAKLLTEEAKARMGRILETRTGMALGTPLYMAPEQAKGESNAICAQTDPLGARPHRPPHAHRKGLLGRRDAHGAHRADRLRADAEAEREGLRSRSRLRRVVPAGLQPRPRGALGERRRGRGGARAGARAERGGARP